MVDDGGLAVAVGSGKGVEMEQEALVETSLSIWSPPEGKQRNSNLLH